jgi:hypothetical protein
MYGSSASAIECGDLNDDGQIAATDALLLLSRAVGNNLSLSCPAAGLPLAVTDVSSESATEMTFFEAAAYCTDLSELSRTDWRLPTRDQLFFALGGGATIHGALSGNVLYTRTANGLKFIGLRLSNDSGGDTIHDLGAGQTLAFVRCVR